MPPTALTRKKPRFCNSEGHTEVCYDPVNARIITAGQNGNIVIFQDHDDVENPKTIEHHTDAILALAVQGNKIISGTVAKIVVSHDLLTLDLDVDKLALFKSPVTSLSLNGSGSSVAASGEENAIKVISTLDSTQVTLLNGHTSAVRSVAYDPKGVYVASSSCDGSVKVWEVSKAQCIKTLTILPVNSNPSPANLCRLAWHPEGSFLAVPTGKNISVIERDAWSVSYTLKEDGHDHDVSIVAWSPNGLYVASVSVDGQILVWDALTKQNVDRYKHDKAITSISWHPQSHTIALADDRGYFTVWENLTPSQLNSKQMAAAAAPTISQTVASLTTSFVLEDSEQKKKKKRKQGHRIASDDEGAGGSGSELEDDGDDEDADESDPASHDGAFSESEVKSASSSASTPASAASDAKKADSKSRAGLFLTTSLSSKSTDKYRQSQSSSLSSFSSKHSSSSSSSSSSKSSRSSSSRVDAAPLQPPFQPGSTPAASKRRFLAWNMKGFIVHRDEHTSSSIDIRFHDATLHRPVKLVDHYNFTMGFLGEQGALFACEGSKACPSTIFFKMFECWAPSSDWTVQLADGESVQAVACGHRWAAAATDRNFLRIFTISGVQRSVLSLDGPVVSMTGSRDLLFVVYHTLPAALHNQQRLGYMVLNIDTNTRVAQGVLPLSSPAHAQHVASNASLAAAKSTATATATADSAPAAETLTPASTYSSSSSAASTSAAGTAPMVTLAWIGFTSYGLPASCDSLGAVRVLSYADYDAAWHMLTDLSLARRNAGDSYWVVGISDANVTCIVCKGGEKHPPVLPEPVHFNVPIAVPVCEPSSEVGRIEEKIMRQRLLQRNLEWQKANRVAASADDDDDEVATRLKTQIDMELIPLFNHACKSDKALRALDICTLLNLQKSITIAMTLATNNHLPALSQRISLVSQANLEREQEKALMDTSSGSATATAPRFSRAFENSSGPLASSSFDSPSSVSFSTPATPLSHQKPTVSSPLPSPFARKRLASTVDKDDADVAKTVKKPASDPASQADDVLRDASSEDVIASFSRKPARSAAAAPKADAHSGSDEDSQTPSKAKKSNPFKANLPTAPSGSGIQSATINRTSSFFDNVRNLSPKKPAPTSAMVR